MTDKRRYQEYADRTELEKCGWNVTKASKYNSGSETLQHSMCKNLVGHYLTHIKGRNVCFEATHAERGEIDVLAWGGDDAPIAVECETSPVEDVVKDKIERYVHGTPIRECFVLNVNNMPTDIHEAYAWIESQL
jgi:hypothetical protein